jgi:hypothetical protein
MFPYWPLKIFNSLAVMGFNFFYLIGYVKVEEEKNIFAPQGDGELGRVVEKGKSYLTVFYKSTKKTKVREEHSSSAFT